MAKQRRAVKVSRQAVAGTQNGLKARRRSPGSARFAPGPGLGGRLRKAEPAPPHRHRRQPPPQTRILRGGRHLRARRPGPAAPRLFGRSQFFRTVLERYPDERELLERARLYLRVCERETSRQPPDRRPPPSASTRRRWHSIPAITLGPSTICSGRSRRTPIATTPTT